MTFSDESNALQFRVVLDRRLADLALFSLEVYNNSQWGVDFDASQLACQDTIRNTTCRPLDRSAFDRKLDELIAVNIGVSGYYRVMASVSSDDCNSYGNYYAWLSSIYTAMPAAYQCDKEKYSHKILDNARLLPGERYNATYVISSSCLRHMKDIRLIYNGPKEPKGKPGEMKN